MSKQLIRRYLLISIVADLCLTAINSVHLTQNIQNWTVLYSHPRPRNPIISPYLVDNARNDPRDAPCRNKHQDPDPPFADLCNHPCNRECFKNSEPMLCRYLFRVENYLSMSKACYDCPFTKEHCFLKDCIAADGVQVGLATINRQLPSPPIEVCHGDMVEVLVENGLYQETTSIHWHGQHMEGYQHMDGVPMVTQCPILPGTSFLYRFKATIPGTHFYHSHTGLQRGDGLYGALIVRQPLSSDHFADLYDYDLSDHVLTVLDHTHMSDLAKYLAHHHSDGDNKPTNILVNGRGRFQEFENEKKEVLYTPMETFTVTQGYRYRFRLINGGILNCPIEVSVDNHTLVVINSDGADLEPIEAKSLITYGGERFDFIIEADQPVNNYWMRFRGLMDCDERYHAVIQGGILHYEGAPEDADPPGELSYKTEPQGLQVNVLNTARNSEKGPLMAELRSVRTSRRDPRLKPEADVKFYVSYDFYQKDNKHYHLPNYYGFNQTDKSQRLYTPQLNHITCKFPSFPLLTNPAEARKTEFCNSSVLPKACETEFCECIHLLRVPLDAVVEVILIDKGFTFDGNHPFHLHGHSFRVIGMDRLGSNVTEEKIRQMDEAGLLMRNLIDAPIKDTVTVCDGGYTIIRFHATNPGYWLFHCHLEFHMENGMALIFKVGEDSDFPPKPFNFPECHNYFPPSKFNNFHGHDYMDEGIYMNDIEGGYLKTSDESGSNNITPQTQVISTLIVFISLQFLTL